MIKHNNAQKKKSKLVAYLLLLFLGMFGAHRFYLGRANSGFIMMVITMIGIILLFIYIGILVLMISFLWVMVDIFLVPAYINRVNSISED